MLARQGLLVCVVPRLPQETFLLFRGGGFRDDSTQLTVSQPHADEGDWPVRLVLNWPGIREHALPELSPLYKCDEGPGK